VRSEKELVPDTPRQVTPAVRVAHDARPHAMAEKISRRTSAFVRRAFAELAAEDDGAPCQSLVEG
jgi:hypothetical protein